MIQKELTINSKHGLHARPAAQFVKTSNQFSAEIWVEKDEERVNGKSIMGLMMLAAGPGSNIMIEADGEDETEAITALETLVSAGFDD
jgi:phosphocarrier protein